MAPYQKKERDFSIFQLLPQIPGNSGKQDVVEPTTQKIPQKVKIIQPSAGFFVYFCNSDYRCILPEPSPPASFSTSETVTIL